MKRLFAGLLIGCLVSPVWAEEADITLEEFLQRLEKIEPWTREKMEAFLGVKLTKAIPGDRTVYKAYDQFVYAKNLIFREVRLEIDGTTKETNMFSLWLDNQSSCFTWEQIKKSYPGGDAVIGSPGAGTTYYKEMPWGVWEFRFDSGRNYRCVTDVGITTNAWIRKQK